MKGTKVQTLGAHAVAGAWCMVVSRASRIIPWMRMRVRKWAGEGKEKYIWAHLPGFCDSVECAECLPYVHNDYYLMSSLVVLVDLCGKSVPVSLARLP